MSRRRSPAAPAGLPCLSAPLLHLRGLTSTGRRDSRNTRHTDFEYKLGPNGPLQFSLETTSVAPPEFGAVLTAGALLELPVVGCKYGGDIVVGKSRRLCNKFLAFQCQPRLHFTGSEDGSSYRGLSVGLGFKMGYAIKLAPTAALPCAALRAKFSCMDTSLYHQVAPEIMRMGCSSSLQQQSTLQLELVGWQEGKTGQRASCGIKFQERQYRPGTPAEVVDALSSEKEFYVKFRSAGGHRLTLSAGEKGGLAMTLGIHF